MNSGAAFKTSPLKQNNFVGAMLPVTLGNMNLKGNDQIYFITKQFVFLLHAWLFYSQNNMGEYTPMLTYTQLYRKRIRKYKCIPVCVCILHYNTMLLRFSCKKSKQRDLIPGIEYKLFLVFP